MTPFPVTPSPVTPSPVTPPSPRPTLVILAAGRSTRFGRLKQLAPVGPGGAALLDYALYDGALAGFGRFVLVIQEALRPDFDAHLRPAASAGLDIRYAYQRLDLAGEGADAAASPPATQTPPATQAPTPPGRTRPWGTGHAVLAAARHVDGPFAVCNADDFYGRDAYAALATAMRNADTTFGKADFTIRPPGHPPIHAFTIGYPLSATLSDSGGVSRGLCEIGEAGALLRLTEGLELRRAGERVRGREVAGRPIDVPAQTPVCTNLWGFPPGILPPLRDLFAEFLASGPGLDREFYLSEAMNDLIAAGRIHCTVLPTDALWLGVTFPGDHAEVAESLRALVDSKAYPMNLWDAPPHLSPLD